jgi:hypothetical protein
MTLPRCSEPIAFDALVAYWSRDLAPEEAERMEEHLMGCAACSGESARVAAVTEALRALPPPYVTDADIAELRARGLRIEENRFSPGERKSVVFRAGVDLLIHRLGGLELGAAERVRVVLSVEETGEVIMDDPRAPFEPKTGEVLIACQRDYAVFPPNLVAEVRARDASGREQVARYAIPHLFDSAP